MSTLRQDNRNFIAISTITILFSLVSAENQQGDVVLHKMNKVGKVRTLKAGSGVFKTTVEDDADFWSRFAEEIFNSMSLPLTDSPSQVTTELPSTPSPPRPSFLPSSEKPLPSPSDHPTKVPTKISSHTPSMLPTDVCIINTRVACTDSDGTDCNFLQKPNTMCSGKDNIQELRFRLTFGACDTSRTTQEEFDDSCNDLAPLPASGESVGIICGGGGMILFSAESVMEGQTVTIFNTRAQSLPNEITCTLFSANGVPQRLQEIIINTSGNEDLYLGDKYGSLEIESCDSSDCITTIEYTYAIENVGVSDAIVDTFERVREYGDPFNSDSQVIMDRRNLTTSMDVLTSKEVAIVSENEQFDSCRDSFARTTYTVVATPPDGRLCDASGNYYFQNSARCRVDIEIACKSEDGIDCQELKPPSVDASGKPITMLRFSFSQCTCEESGGTHTQGTSASCHDSADILSDINVLITCTGDDGTTFVGSQLVEPDGSIIIRAEDGTFLPKTLTCSIRDGTNTLLQTVSFDASGTVDLSLKDKFGSLELEAFADASGMTADCLSVLCFEYKFRNVGTNNIDITGLTMIRNGDTEELLQQLLNGVNTLAPGESVSLDDKETIDLCLPGNYNTTTIGEADSPNGGICTDKDSYSFSIKPDCELFLELTCNAAGGFPCTTIEGEQLVECRCDDCVEELRFRYTANNCQSGLPDCTETATGPTEFANLVIMGNGESLYDASVSIGSDIVLRGGGECLPTLVEVVITTGTEVEASQTISIDTRCTGSIALLDNFGALEFAGYTCRDEEAHNCYVSSYYEVIVTNKGTVEGTITSWDFILNDEMVFSLPNPIDLPPMSDVPLTHDILINRCGEGQYIASSTVNGIGLNGLSCPDSKTLIFDIVTGTPFPSPPPSESPRQAPSRFPSESSTSSPSNSPSISPSFSPSAVPSDTPSTPPSITPSKAPSSYPSNTPSTSPSLSPSGGPSVPPTSSPSTLPTSTPSLYPSISPTGTCIIDAQLTCSDSSGVECSLLEQPDNQCSVGESIQTVRFRLSFCTCAESRNTQEGFHDTCNDLDMLPAEGSGVTLGVTCTGDGYILLSAESVAEGESMTVLNLETGFLPNEIICALYGSDGIRLQEFTIDTSGNKDLYLGDKYGSFELESCDSRDCIETVFYTYVVENSGQDDAIVTMFERVRELRDTYNQNAHIDIDRSNLMPNSTVLPAGSVGFETESVPFDLCRDSKSITTVTISAIPPDGVPCGAAVEYSFDTSVRCRLDVKINCESEDGTMCQELQSPSAGSIGQQFTMLRLRFRDCACEESENTHNQADSSTCKDVAEIPPNTNVDITCFGTDGTILVDRLAVEPDESFVIAVEEGKVLPGEITCIVANTEGMLYQQVSFDTSGTVGLFLKDKFGSFELEAFTDVAGMTADCVVALCYLYEIQNVGRNNMDISRITRIRNEISQELLSLLVASNTELLPGESTSIEKKETLDLCIAEQYDTTTIIEANSPNEDLCADEDMYSFQIEPECNVFLQLTCALNDGARCIDIEGEQLVECRCDDCATELRFRYTAARCNPGNQDCIESIKDLPASSNIVVTGAGETLYDATVNRGSDVVLSRGGACLPDKLEFIVRPLAEGLESSQILSIDTRCTGSITLLDEFGAFEFVGYSCQGETQSHNCYVNATYNISVVNMGTIDATVTSWNSTLNGDKLVSLPSPTIIPSKSDFSLSQIIEVERCIANKYVATSDVSASGAYGVTCSDSAIVRFEVVTGTLFPSPSPSETPSEIPSKSSSEYPTTSPSFSPSRSPSIPPSVAPSLIPSASPSTQPSAPPSDRPTKLPSHLPSAAPTVSPSASPTSNPSATPSSSSSVSPSIYPSFAPTSLPSRSPSFRPNVLPSTLPSAAPTNSPSASPSASPTTSPSIAPMVSPSVSPSKSPSSSPTNSPSVSPSINLSTLPSNAPSASPIASPSVLPSSFPSISPTSSPSFSDCEMVTDLICTTQNGVDCTSKINGEELLECSCDLCPQEIWYRYTGNQCQPGLASCTDIGSGPKEFAIVSIASGAEILFAGNVEIDFDIVLNRPGSCIPNHLEVSVSGPSGTPLQSVSIDFTCTGSTLKDNYGALQFVGYSCLDDKIVHNCYTDVDYEMTVTNVGRGLIFLNSWEFAVNSETLLSLPSLVSFRPNQALPLTLSIEIDLCIPGQYVASFLVNGAGENGIPCPTETVLIIPLDIGTPYRSPSPSEIPSSSPNMPPSKPPSVAPGLLPSASPSASLTTSPSVIPATEFCEFDLDVDCIPPPGSTTCDVTPSPVQICNGRPTQMGFLFNSGFCNESFNVQNNDGQDIFLCEDLQMGPTQDGEAAYIVIADTDFETRYFEGWVGYREVFYASAGGERFPANQIIRIYNSTDMSNPASLIQDIQYQSSCSSNLFLKDRFGGVQLVEWINEEQGVISCFFDQTFEMDISIPIDIDGGQATITSLTVESNFEPFYFNLTDTVAGTVIPAGAQFQAMIDIPIDLTERRTYNLLLQVDAMTRLRRLCRATELVIFTAGYPLPPIFPTLLPTVSPTGTYSPTPDPGSTPCNIDANIECITFSGRSCVTISPPTETFCNSESGIPLYIDLQYTGSGLQPAPFQVRILALGGRRGDIIIFNATVSAGEGMRFSTGFDEELSIIFSDTNGNEIGQGRFIADCDGNSLALLDQIGPLQVIGFSTEEQGTQAAIEIINVRYLVNNVGFFDSRLISALKTSAFSGGPTEILFSPQEIQPGEEVSLSPDFTALNLVEGGGTTYEFSFDIIGESSLNGLRCSDGSMYVFQT